MNRAHYSEITTLAQLRLERVRVHGKLAATEADIKEDVSEVGGLFSFEGIMGMLFPRSMGSAGCTAMNAAISAWDLVSSVVGMVRSKRRRRSCGC